MYTYNLPLLARISHSQVLSTELTILSPFTKEDCALHLLTGIPMFLLCPFGGSPKSGAIYKVGAVKMCLPNKQIEFQSCP